MQFTCLHHHTDADPSLGTHIWPPPHPREHMEALVGAGVTPLCQTLSPFQCLTPIITRGRPLTWSVTSWHLNVGVQLMNGPISGTSCPLVLKRHALHGHSIIFGIHWENPIITLHRSSHPPNPVSSGSIYMQCSSVLTPRLTFNWPNRWLTSCGGADIMLTHSWLICPKSVLLTELQT